MASKAQPSSSMSYADTVLAIRDSHQGQKIFEVGFMSLGSEGVLKCINVFLGSPQAIFLSSKTKMEFEPPACIAAPLVTMVAKEAISLGINNQTSVDKVVIYAAEQIFISSDHVTIGNIQFMIAPKCGFITCKKLTLVKFQGEKDPDYFQGVKSWLVFKDTVIEYLEIPVAIPDPR